jgi:hypothetical protein
MYNLANTYGILGKCEDALELFKNALDILQRVLPENHPQIGVLCHCQSVLHRVAHVFRR